MKLTLSQNLRSKYFELLNEVFDSGFWSEGQKLQSFEDEFSRFTNIPSLAVSSGGTALYAILKYLNLQDKEVIVPANTFWATITAIKHAGGIPVYADCSRKDLCIPLSEIKRLISRKTKAIVVVHIGGHIAFEIEEIASYCKKKGIFLVEDCAHAHGATFNEKSAGSFGVAGAYSFYSTKTMPLGEGGMICSNDKDLLKWVKAFRNYGKEPTDNGYKFIIKNGFNLRMNEFTAALGLIQTRELPHILKWKRELASKFDQIFKNRIQFPKGMESGYYKYIVFDYKLTEKTGQVYSKKDLASEIEPQKDAILPNSYKIATHHQCTPIYYGWEGASLSIDQIKSRLLANA